MPGDNEEVCAPTGESRMEEAELEMQSDSGEERAKGEWS